jgi:hypothetical protein
MFEALLSFFADLILFTAGLAVATLWLLLFIEVYDQIREVIREVKKDRKEEEEL